MTRRRVTLDEALRNLQTSMLAMDPQTFWKIMGLKWQVAAEPLLRKMGYRILKAQHRALQSRKRLPLLHDDPDLNDYLWNYADYVAAKGTRAYLVDVKAQAYVRLWGQREPTTTKGGTVPFRGKEMEAYRGSRIPALVLLVLYQYDEDMDIRRMGPVYYKLVPFQDFQFPEGSTSGRLPEKFKGCRKLMSSEAYALLRRTNALWVVEVGPGFYRIERDHGYAASPS